MSPEGETPAHPIDHFVRYQDMMHRRQQRVLRAAMGGIEGADELREKALEHVRVTPGKRRNEEEMQERLYLLGFLGGEEEFDALVELVMPDDEDDIPFLALHEHPLLRDEETRAQYLMALGSLGQHVGNRDNARLETLAFLLRRGLGDEMPDVRIAAAGAISRSMKYSKQGMTHYAPLVRSLVRLLGEPGWSVKRAALSALADLPTPECQLALTRFAAQQEDEHLKHFAEWALNRVAERSGVFRSLVRSLESMRKPTPR